jgi:hypothetical protein
MRFATLISAAAIAAFAVPALAQAPARNDTVTAIIAHGAVASVGGMDYAITYKADGTYEGNGGELSGAFKAEGNKICLDIMGMESCTEYPAGKKSGDAFEVQSPFGPMQIKIK